MTEAQSSSSALREFAVEIVRRLTAEGHRALFAGGCVRDKLLGVEPKDYDVATSARPEQVQAYFPRTVAVGVAFGVVRVLGTTRDRAGGAGGGTLEAEVATFRREGGYEDGRHPTAVTFCEAEEDARRRDFTINGLFHDPLKDEVVDYVGGRRDLERRVIRAIGDPRARFAEDYLRLLRAVRFAAQLDFEIEGTTLGALKSSAPLIAGISAERIRDELARMLTGPRPRRALELLHATRLLRVILPEAEALVGVEQGDEHHPEGDAWQHTLLLLENLHRAPLPLALAALLHDIGKPPTHIRSGERIRFHEHEKVGAEMTMQILRRLRFPNADIELTAELVRQHMAFKDVQKMRAATLKRFLRQPHFGLHLELHRLDCLASHGKLALHEFCKGQLAALDATQLRPPPLLDGHTLLGLGLAAGPLLGTILRDVEDRQLEGTLRSPGEALAYVRAAYLVPQVAAAGHAARRDARRHEHPRGRGTVPRRDAP